MLDRMLPLLVIFMPTAFIAYLALAGKILPQNRRMMMILLAFIIVTDGTLAYFLWTGKLGGPRRPTVAEELAKYPTEAQGFAFTKRCQEMVREGAGRKARSPEIVEEVSLTVCTCITAGVMNHGEFPAIEAMASEGKVFGTIVEAHKDAVQSGLGGCGLDKD
ncbi:MAG: hypothetical protein EOP11_26440 [Proteobacteria bacterium]|nr:MAG: hypothetical protein EOP11_26440 [Pseudomonadota bacterium]